MIVGFHTLGCKTNAYETQAIQEQFQAEGFEIGEFSGDCDVYIINTCAVTQEAARKSRQMIGRCKKHNPNSVVVVTGCYAQDSSEKVLEELNADIVVGNSEKSKIPELVKEMLSDCGRKISCVKDLTRCTDYEEQEITNQGDHVRAYVKIQDGCDRFCSYCLIPFMRGRSRSRSMENIIAEAEKLAKGGYHEIVLTGIDISTFDAGKGTEEDIAQLIEKLGNIEGIERIRLGSLEVGIVTDRLIKRLSDLKEFCPQFHLSLQSGCDTVLKRMNRHYSSREYAESVDIIRKYYPKAAITTDIIAGFPGETEEEFNSTMDFVKKIRFSRIHAFPYSRRAKTKADQMPGQLTKAVKEARAKELIALGETIRKEYEEQFAGKECRLLIEEAVEIKGKIYLAGYTPEYIYILADPDRIGLHFSCRDEAETEMVNKVITVVPVLFENGNLMA